MIGIIPPAFADKGTFVDEIRFIQYLDENTALEEVRNGYLDMYYYRVSSDRLKDSDSKDGLRVYESTGGYYSILLNPTDEGPFNPFSIREIRYSINFLVDRDLIVSEGPERPGKDQFYRLDISKSSDQLELQILGQATSYSRSS